MNELIAKIKGKSDFIEFMSALNLRLKQKPADWENKSLEDYLESMQSWIEDMDGYYINNDLPIPTNINWKFLAELLVAASMYE